MMGPLRCLMREKVPAVSIPITILIAVLYNHVQHIVNSSGEVSNYKSKFMPRTSLVAPAPSSKSAPLQTPASKLSAKKGGVPPPVTTFDKSAPLKPLYDPYPHISSDKWAPGG